MVAVAAGGDGGAAVAVVAAVGSILLRVNRHRISTHCSLCSVQTVLCAQRLCSVQCVLWPVLWPVLRPVLRPVLHSGCRIVPHGCL